MGQRKRYTGEDKVKILREPLEDGKPVSQVAEGHGVHPNLILSWRRERSSPSSCSRGRRRHSGYGGLTLPGSLRNGRPGRWKKSCGRRTGLSPNCRPEPGKAKGPSRPAGSDPAAGNGRTRPRFSACTPFPPPRRPDKRHNPARRTAAAVNFPQT
jgi:hypothetical protein